MLAVASPASEGRRARKQSTAAGENRRRRRNVLWAVGSVCGTALAGAVATAIITPESIHDLLPGSSASSAPTSVSARPLKYKRVEDRSGALALEVPEAWSAGDSTLDVNGRVVGPGLTAGPDPSLPVNTTESRAFLGAQLMSNNGTSPSDSEWQDVEAHVVRDLRLRDWTLDHCEFDREKKVEREDDVEIIYRVWRNCGQRPQVMYDGVALPSDGSYVAYVQVQLSKEVGEGVAEHVLETLRVLPERLDDAG
jgi:hypothetical protein